MFNKFTFNYIFIVNSCFWFLLLSSDKENVHSDEEKVKNEVDNEGEVEIEEKDKLEKPEKDDILDENGNEEQV